jgi:Tol biopolymer transport system component
MNGKVFILGQMSLWSGLVWLAGCASMAGPREPSIVFSSDRTGGGDIYIAREDGSRQRQLTRDPSPERFPRCSPDGRFVVFVRGDGASAELIRLDLRTGDELGLTRNNVREATPEWSPDGRRIYFTRTDGAHDRIAVMESDGAEVRFLTDGGAHDVMPALSPDGRLLVHHSYRYGRDTELQLFDLAAARGRRLTEAAGSDYEASFADSATVLFSSNRAGGHFRLYRLSLTDGSARLLADVGADAWGARYSAATGAILFYSGRPGAWRLMRTTLDGQVPVSVIADGMSNSGGDWCRSS